MIIFADFIKIMIQTQLLVHLWSKFLGIIIREYLTWITHHQNGKENSAMTVLFKEKFKRVVPSSLTLCTGAIEIILT